MLNLHISFKRPPRIANFGRWISGQNFIDKAKAKRSSCPACEDINEDYEDEYVIAYNHGKEGKCQHHYQTSCPISFFSTFHL